MFKTAAFWFVLLSVFTASADAAEVILRATATPQGTVLRLGDVAEVRGASEKGTQELAALPLMPSPAPGTRQFISARQIRDMLQAAGRDVSAYRFTGAAQVAITGEIPRALQTRVGRLSTTQLRRIQEDLQSAIARHLDAVSGGTQPWRIELAAQDDQLMQLAEATIPWTIEGGHEPWTGQQVFTVACHTPGGVNELQLEAQIALPDPVVVLTAPLARGATVGRADVMLTRDIDDSRRHLLSSGFHVLEDVVGKVARRTLRPGQILTASMIEEPTLVRRGQTVRVVALSRGIRVTTYARARQSGTQGELIYVESLDEREPFTALVSGVREVQVLGR